MNCFEKVTVNAQAINWLKEKYPELCIKAGLCERIGGGLYTKTFIDPPAAQPEQEPVGTFDVAINERTAAINYDCRKHKLVSGTKLYTTPPAQQRKPLAKVEIEKILSTHYMYTEDLIRAVEAAHGIKEQP